MTDIIEAARALTPRALAALDKALDDPARAVQAAQVLLDRAWGKPPVAVYAQVHGAGPNGVIRYEFVWGKAQEDPAANGQYRQVPSSAPPTINGDAEGDTEAREVAPVYCWADGTPVK